jgi:hypothetical protein
MYLNLKYFEVNTDIANGTYNPLKSPKRGQNMPKTPILR